jgi:hypothetical protein
MHAEIWQQKRLANLWSRTQRITERGIFSALSHRRVDVFFKKRTI